MLTVYVYIYREVGTIIRSLDCYPSEADLADIISEVRVIHTKLLLHTSHHRLRKKSQQGLYAMRSLSQSSVGYYWNAGINQSMRSNYLRPLR